MSHFYVQNIVMYFDFRVINADFNVNFWRENQIYLICERLLSETFLIYFYPLCTMFVTN